MLYPSKAELVAQRTADNGLLSLDDALEKPLSPQARHGIKCLKLRVPDELSGMFKVQISDKELAALQVLPDAPSDAFNALLGEIDKKHTYHQHGAHFMLRYEGEELQTLIDTPPLNPARELTSLHANVIREGYDAKRSYESEEKTFAGSFRLSDARQLRNLPQTEKNMLKRFAAVVGHDLTGAFAVNLTEQDGKPQIASLCIAPNIIGQQMVDEILYPIARQAAGHTRDMRSVGMRPHGSTAMIERDTLKEIDTALRKRETRKRD